LRETDIIKVEKSTDSDAREVVTIYRSLRTKIIATVQLVLCD